MPRTMWPGWNYKRQCGPGFKYGESSYHDLLSLRKEVMRVSVQLQFAQFRDGNEFNRNDLSGIEQIKTKA
jgi:hypothetical protein